MGKIFDGNVGDLESFLDEKGFKFYKSVEIDNIYIAKDFQKVWIPLTDIIKPIKSCSFMTRFFFKDLKSI